MTALGAIRSIPRSRRRFSKAPIACKLWRSARRKPGRGSHVFKVLPPIFRAIGPAGRASAPGPGKAHAVIPTAPGLGVAGRSPTGATGCTLPRSARRNPGRGFRVFKALRPVFRAIGPAGATSAAGLVKARAVIPSAPGLRVTGRSPTGATACKLRRSTRRKPGRGFHVFKALRPIFRAIGPATRASAPGPVKASAVTARAPGLGLTGRSPTGATACGLRRSTRRNLGRGFHVFNGLRPIFWAIGRSQLPRSPPSARAPSTMLRMVPLPRADARGRKGRRRLSSPVERMRNGGGGPSEGRSWGPRRDGAWQSLLKPVSSPSVRPQEKH